MKPKNRVYCAECRRPKIVFETERTALNFIKFNADDIEAERGVRPIRAYFCKSCGAYHVTSQMKHNRFNE